MKFLWSLLFSITFSSSMLAHEIHLAVFDLYQEEGQYQLLTVFDRNDLVESLQDYYQHDIGSEDEGLLLDCVKDYLDDHLNFRADGRTIEFFPTALQLKAEVINIHMDLPFYFEKPRILDIQNSLLLDLFPQQTHLFRFQGQVFKMNDKRRDIQLVIQQ